MTVSTYYNSDTAYPAILKQYEDMPKKLYVRGTLPDPDRPTVAIVGARSCTNYGKNQASRYARILAEHGVQIISGLAFGIDTAAHEGCIQGGMPTFGVIASGIDICYPKENYPLYEKIIRTGGGILTEFEAGSEPLGWHFPRRNRIISGLADAVLVIEAREKSGSLITADLALDQGKNVYALPGRVSDSTSTGCNRLIAQGAGIAWCPELLLEELGLGTFDFPGEKHKRNRTENLQIGLGRILTLFDEDNKTLENLMEETRMERGELTRSLLLLMMDGQIREISPGVYSKNA